MICINVFAFFCSKPDINNHSLPVVLIFIFQTNRNFFHLCVPGLTWQNGILPEGFMWWGVGILLNLISRLLA